MKDKSTFTCDRCDGTFPSILSDEEAMELWAIDFPGVPFTREGTEELCEECYRKAMQAEGRDTHVN